MVILDNVSIHHVEAVKAIEDLGAIIHFLPPYSPDFNPIKEAFSKVKISMRSLQDMTMQVVDIYDCHSINMIANTGLMTHKYMARLCNHDILFTVHCVLHACSCPSNRLVAR